jgi:hypothetical protein
VGGSPSASTSSPSPAKRWQVFAPKRRHGLYAVDTLAPHWVVNADKTHYFHDIIQSLRSCGYTDGYSLFAFGYDWRQVRVGGGKLSACSPLHSSTTPFVPQAERPASPKAIGNACRSLKYRALVALFTQNRIGCL